MLLLSKVIIVIMLLNSAADILWPEGMKGAALYFSELSGSAKRMIGLIYLFLGMLLVFLTRIYPAVPVVHWIVAVSGIYMVTAGALTAAVPRRAAYFLNWFYKDRAATVAVGLLLAAVGISLMVLI